MRSASRIRKVACNRTFCIDGSGEGIEDGWTYREFGSIWIIESHVIIEPFARELLEGGGQTEAWAMSSGRGVPGVARFLIEFGQVQAGLHKLARELRTLGVGDRQQ